MEKINSEVFLEVVKTGSFKAAATRLGYTQAGISYIINTIPLRISSATSNLSMIYHRL